MIVPVAAPSSAPVRPTVTEMRCCLFFFSLLRTTSNEDVNQSEHILKGSSELNLHIGILGTVTIYRSKKQGDARNAGDFFNMQF